MLEGLALVSGRDAPAATEPDDWVREVARLWDDPRERGALGQAARRYVEENHRWETCLSRIDALVGDEVQGPGVGRVDERAIEKPRVRGRVPELGTRSRTWLSRCGPQRLVEAARCRSEGCFSSASSPSPVCSLWSSHSGVSPPDVTHYHSYPERSWWGASLASLGVRYSFTISLSVAVGTLLNLRRLPYGRLISRQETLYLAFLAWVFIARQLNGQETQEDVLDKMLKMAVFLLCLTHVLVTRRQFDRFLWVLVCCALYLGYECFTVPGSRFTKGRLEGVGGPDFGDANAMAAHLVVLLAIIGVQFLRSGGKGKLVCIVAGGLIVKGILQMRSRWWFSRRDHRCLRGRSLRA